MEIPAVSDRDVDRASVIILAKRSDMAKSRLRLPRNEARQIALVLAAATVRTTLAAGKVGTVLVVTADAAIAVQALEAGADVMLEARPLGMNHAAAIGRRQALRARPGAPVAVLVADLPCLRPSDIDVAIQDFHLHKRPTYVADHHGMGTTFLIHGPQRQPGIAFGHDSAAMHRRLGYQAARTARFGLRADLDTLEDLDQFGGLIEPRSSGQPARAAATATAPADLSAFVH